MYMFYVKRFGAGVERIVTLTCVLVVFKKT